MNETWLIGTGRLTTPCQGDDSGISSRYESPPTMFQLRLRSEILLAGWSKYFVSVSCMTRMEKTRKA